MEYIFSSDLVINFYIFFFKLSDEEIKLEKHLDEERYRALFVEELEEDIRHGIFLIFFVKELQLQYFYLFITACTF